MTDYEDEDEDDSESDEDVDDMEPPKVLGDLLESLAGAIFIDSGMDLQAVWSVLEPLFTAKIGTYTQHNTFNSSFFSVYCVELLQW